MKYVYLFDQFTRGPKLKIDGKKRISSIYVSVLGILFFIGYLIASFILLFTVIKKDTFYMIENTNSNYFTNITYDTQIPLMALISDPFGMEFPDYERIFEFKLKFFSNFMDPKGLTPNVNIIDINRTECKYNKLNGDDDNRYSQLLKIYKSTFCFDLKPYNISISGTENAGTSSLLIFYLNECVNTTASSNCLPKKVIDKKLGDIKLSFIFPNRDIDNEFRYPFIDYTDSSVFKFSNSIKSRYKLELDTIEFISDDGLFFEDKVKYTSYKAKSSSLFQNIKIGSKFHPKTIGNINIAGSGKKKIFQRRYLKIHYSIPYLVAIYHSINIFFKLIVGILGKGGLDKFFLSKVIEKEEYEKIKKTEKILKYEDIFKPKPLNENMLEKEIEFQNQNNQSEEQYHNSKDLSNSSQKEDKNSENESRQIEKNRLQVFPHIKKNYAGESPGTEKNENLKKKEQEKEDERMYNSNQSIVPKKNNFLMKNNHEIKIKEQR